MFRKLFKSSEYNNAKTRIKNFSSELKAVGSKKLTNGDLMRFRDRYKSIVIASNKKNISQKEHEKLDAALEEFRERFKYLGFIDDMEPFMPSSIPELASETIHQKHEESRRYNLRSTRKDSDDGKYSVRQGQDHASGEYIHSAEYYRIANKLRNFISHLENVSQFFSLEDLYQHQRKFKEIGDSIRQADFSRRESAELSHLYSEFGSRFKNLADKVTQKNTQNYYRKNEVPRNDFQKHPVNEDKIQNIILSGSWTPNYSSSTSETKNLKTDLPQVHSSGVRTEPEENRGLTPSSSGASLQNKTIDWDVLETHPDPECRSNHSSIKPTANQRHIETVFAREVDKTGIGDKAQNIKRSEETAAEILRRSLLRNDEITKKVPEREPNYQDSQLHKYGSSCRKYNNERKPHEEYRTIEIELEDLAAGREERLQILPTRYDSIEHNTARTQRSYDQRDHSSYNIGNVNIQKEHKETSQYPYIYSGEFRGRGRSNRHSQSPEEKGKDFVGRHQQNYSKHQENTSYSHSETPERPHWMRADDDLSTRSRLDEHEPTSQSRHDRRSPLYHQNQEMPRYDDHTEIEQAKEVKEEPLEILDVHKYFRDDFDLNSLDALDNNIEKIDAIDQYARTFESKVKSFDGDLLEFFVVDEKLMRLIEKLDKIKCQDDRRAAEKKVKLIQYINGLHAILDERANDD